MEVDELAVMIAIGCGVIQLSSTIFHHAILHKQRKQRLNDYTADG